MYTRTPHRVDLKLLLVCLLVSCWCVAGLLLLCLPLIALASFRPPPLKSCLHFHVLSVLTWEHTRWSNMRAGTHEKAHTYDRYDSTCMRAHTIRTHMHQPFLHVEIHKVRHLPQNVHFQADQVTVRLNQDTRLIMVFLFLVPVVPQPQGTVKHFFVIERDQNVAGNQMCAWVQNFRKSCWATVLLILRIRW